MAAIDHAIHTKTVFCDIDGCIFQHTGSMCAIITLPGDILPGVIEAFTEWSHKGYIIVLTTGRPESLRDFTDIQIRKAGLYYHHMIMGLPRGQRVIINDTKPDRKTKSAACVNLPRNMGMKNVNI
jgi:hypothetical protein